MYHYSYALLVAAVTSYFLTPGLSSPGEFVIGPADTALKPININDFEAATGLQRRAAEDFSRLDLDTQAQLIYGRPEGKPLHKLHRLAPFDIGLPLYSSPND